MKHGAEHLAMYLWWAELTAQDIQCYYGQYVVTDIKQLTEG
jgi:hypothetical protein